MDKTHRRVTVRPRGAPAPVVALAQAPQPHEQHTAPPRAMRRRHLRTARKAALQPGERLNERTGLVEYSAAWL